jgi:hypothetical protein
MVKTFVRILQTAASLILVITVIYFALSLRPRTGEPAAPATPLDPVTALEARYADLGIPLESMRVVQRSPLELVITLLSASNDKRWTEDDHWQSLLAKREAELAYLITGEHISNYNLRMTNAKGEDIDLGTSFLYPNLLSQQLAPANPPAIGDEETKQLLVEELNLGENEWLALEVQSDHITRPNTKYVYMEWSTATDSFEESKRRVQALGGLGSGGVYNIDNFNARHGAQIALVRVKVFDLQGGLLAQFIYDAETQRQSVWMADGIKPEWLPSPAEPQEVTPTPIPEPTSLPPLPTMIPTPYP